jgi:pimeloyl-ACP methyl ester carboxylesterase
MEIIDVGSGPPVVVIPGVQGRWEWMAPGIDALARECRVITFSLADEPGSGARFDESSGFSCYVDQVRDAMDQAGVERAAICGVSYGGLIAATFAARYPERSASLVLVSAPPPSWKPDRRIQFFLRAPRLLSPFFCIGSMRLYREIAAASGGLGPGALAAARHGWRALTHMFSPSRMARRVLLLRGLDLWAEMAAVAAPVLLVTGDAILERIVPVRMTHEYLKLWPAARTATIARTGHLGVLTRPDEFTHVVAPFVEEIATPCDDCRRRLG